MESTQRIIDFLLKLEESGLWYNKAFYTSYLRHTFGYYSGKSVTAYIESIMDLEMVICPEAREIMLLTRITESTKESLMVYPHISEPVDRPVSRSAFRWLLTIPNLHLNFPNLDFEGMILSNPDNLIPELLQILAEGITLDTDLISELYRTLSWLIQNFREMIIRGGIENLLARDRYHSSADVRESLIEPYIHILSDPVPFLVKWRQSETHRFVIESLTDYLLGLSNES